MLENIIKIRLVRSREGARARRIRLDVFKENIGKTRSLPLVIPSKNPQSYSAYAFRNKYSVCILLVYSWGSHF